ncbi:hypothetical protein S245_020740, partial [Arachis hypogaea]
IDLNYVEESPRDTDVTVGILPPKLDSDISSNSKLPIDILKNVMQLTIEDCK